MKNLVKAVQEMVLEHPTKNGEQICIEACGLNENGASNKPVFTLYRELNPNDDGAKLGLITFVQLLPVCGNLKPLALIAAKVGCRLVPVHGGPDGEDMRHECLQGYAAVSDLIKAAERGASHGEIAGLLERAVKELEDLFVRARDRDYEQGREQSCP